MLNAYLWAIVVIAARIPTQARVTTTEREVVGVRIAGIPDLPRLVTSAPLNAPAAV
ncbi:hypothetical protein Ahu01nite_032440 [Winogradskya humida]|uniref:Uncharacterized protein n=1 Tax=Winogradskya humida TaxID=113566 RepID=A0ABQ3ZNL9_9ACTN|nr:hypothetical protein Ahu01nite_032440 [Actinoplanes humidus]